MRLDCCRRTTCPPNSNILPSYSIKRPSVCDSGTASGASSASGFTSDVRGATMMATITAAGIEAYVVERPAEGAANAIVNRELALLKRMYGLAMKDNPPVDALRRRQRVH